MATLAAGGAGAYATCLEPYSLETTFKVIGEFGLKKRVRVLHLSDFHASRVVPWDLIRKSVEIGMSNGPDVVLLTGDFVSKAGFDVGGYQEALSALAGHPLCFASLGNHDGRFSAAAKVVEQLEKAGVKLLHNRGVEVDGLGLRIAGLGDLWRHEVEPGRCLERIEDAGLKTGAPRVITLLMAHNPDTKEVVADYDWDVMFSGHTHGGQVVMPIFNWAPALPVEDRSMVAGIYPWKGRQIHITRGVGNLWGLRFNCRPEVSIVDLH